MLKRNDLESSILKALSRARGVVLRGPRQSGKSTLAQGFLSRRSPNYFDLEYPPHAARLENPTQALEALKGLVVIDEVQLQPGLFPLLRALMDRSNAPGQFLLLGSASPALLRQSGESLLGRVETVEVSGFTLPEIVGTLVIIVMTTYCSSGYAVVFLAPIWPQMMKTVWPGASMRLPII